MPSDKKRSRRTGYWVCGIDEAGRGPLAGPLTVAGVCVRIPNRPSLKTHSSLLRSLRFGGLRDSKRLTSKARQAWFLRLCRSREILCRSSVVGQKTIDRINVARAADLGVEKVLERLSFKPALVLLDGSLHAPAGFRHKIISGGDRKVPLIAAASVIAKVRRDRIMERYHKKYPKWRFDLHKGYGTKLHQRLLKRFGPSSIHRKTFIANLLRVSR